MVKGFSPPPNPQARGPIQCQLFATAYSMYSQLLPISGGCLLHPQTEDALWSGDRDPHNMTYHKIKRFKAQTRIPKFRLVCVF